MLSSDSAVTAQWPLSRIHHTLSVTRLSSLMTELLCRVRVRSSALAASLSAFIWPLSSWKWASIISLSSFRILFLSSHSLALAAILAFSLAISSYSTILIVNDNLLHSILTYPPHVCYGKSWGAPAEWSIFHEAQPWGAHNLPFLIQ